MITQSIFKYEELFEDQLDGTVLLTIPPLISEKIGINPGDTVEITIDDNKLFIKKYNGKE